LIPNSFRRHHWSRASILSTSLLVTAQHSEPYSIINIINDTQIATNHKSRRFLHSVITNQHQVI